MRKSLVVLALAGALAMTTALTPALAQTRTDVKVGLVLDRRSPTSPHVRRGWVEAAAECRLDVESTVDLTVPDARDPTFDAVLDEVLDRTLSTGTTALVVHADAQAIALVQHCEERHVAFPGDLSIVAYDDEVAGLFSPPLTVVRQPTYRLGQTAAHLVMQMIRGEPVEPPPPLAVELIVRASCSAPPASVGRPVADRPTPSGNTLHDDPEEVAIREPF